MTPTPWIVRAWDALAGLLGDVGRWLRAGPRGHARYIDHYGTLLQARLRISDLEASADARRRQIETVEDRLADARSEIDDLCLRILETTLDVGRIATVEVEIPAGMPWAPNTYTRESVDRILDVARQALTSADDLARWATYRRKYHRLQDPEGSDRRSLESLLRRIETILGDAAEESDRRPPGIPALEVVDDAAAHVIELLRDAPIRRTLDPARLP